MPSSLPTNVACVRDTCNVWVVKRRRDAVCIDFGSGTVLERLDELGIDRITDVVVTHFHRDCVQGLARAVEAGARVWVPPIERDFFVQADELWARRRPQNDYGMFQDRFAPLEPVEIAGSVDEYRSRAYGGIELYALPTPGHTVGSVTYLAILGGRRIAFSGDLLYAPGRVWSLAATQWTYTGVEGLAASILSCGTLARRRPDLLLPAHGQVMTDPDTALTSTQAALAELMEMRRTGEPWNLESWLESPWERLSPHLLRNRTSLATSYAVLSESGEALLIDWGYDLWTGAPLGGERATQRPLLASIEVLERDYGVSRAAVAITTHYHDDHVAGLGLLREVHGTEVWAPANVAPILVEPERYDLPCLWYEPVPVDRLMPLGEAVTWREYKFTAHAQPGHTLYAAAIAFEVDGRRILAIGDQQGEGEPGGSQVLNYQYRNRFRSGDYIESAALYARLRPDVLLGGHWPPREVTEELLSELAADGRRLHELHSSLLPDDADLGAAGFIARLLPYRSATTPRASLDFEVELRNPFGHVATATIRLALPAGWQGEPVEVELAPHAEATAELRVLVGNGRGRHVIAADVTVDGTPFGQQAEALVTIE